VFALTADGVERDSRRIKSCPPETSFWMRLAISINRRQARSRNDIMRSMSRSLGRGISILRSPSATFGLWPFLSESDFGIASSLLPATVPSRSASCALSFSFSACSRPISVSIAARSSGTA
jgi:hypothetical protein